MTREHGLPLCVDEDHDERWRGDPGDYTPDVPDRSDLARECDEIEEDEE